MSCWLTKTVDAEETEARGNAGSGQNTERPLDYGPSPHYCRTETAESQLSSYHPTRGWVDVVSKDDYA